MKTFLLAAAMATTTIAGLAGAQITPAPQPAPAPAPRGGGGMIVQADADGDGVVTRAEFVAAADKRFQQQDTNRDGKVSAEERAAKMPARGGMPGRDGDVTLDQARMRAGKMFDRIDANRDGKVDRAEVAARRKMMRERRGAAATAQPATGEEQ